MSDVQPEQNVLRSGFNLCDKPWIPVLLTSGDTQEVSLIDLFKQGYSIRKIHSDDATVDTAILGTVIVILARAILTTREEYKALYNKNSAWILKMRTDNAEQLRFVTDYLEKHKDRFDLLHPERPFMQVADLHTAKGDTQPVSRLVLDSRSEYFSVRAEETLTSLSFAEAARYLIALQAYDYSGIKSGAVGDPRVKGGKGYPLGVGWYGTTGKVIVHGKNLIETLLYSLDYEQLTSTTREAGELYPSAIADKPVWERVDPDTAAPRGFQGGDPDKYKDEPKPASGMCEILTWQSRRVRLFREGDRITSVLVANGDKWFDRNVYADPLTGYRYSKNQSSKTHKVWMPQAHSAERTLWRGADALLICSKSEKEENKPAPVLKQIASGYYFPADATVNIQLVGVIYGNQSAVIEGVVDESITLELRLLTQQGIRMSSTVRKNIQSTMDAAIALGQYAGNLLRAAGREYEFRAPVTEGILHRMEEEFRNWVSHLHAGDSSSEKETQWQKTVNRILIEEADRLAVSAGPKAAVGTIYGEQLYTTANALNQFKRRLRYKLLPSAYLAEQMEDKKTTLQKNEQEDTGE